MNDLCKDFEIQDRREGVLGNIKDIFDRRYKVKHAVNDVSFHIDKGEIVGYIGPNGAGKSTTIKMISGILTPTSGTVKVNGICPYENRKENAKNIGVVFGQRTQLWWDIPVIESLNLMQKIYKIPDKQFKKNMNIFIDLLEMGKFIDTPVRQLSLGQRMRADFACALLHNPKVLYLDEPTIGLDVVVKERIREFIKEVNEQIETTIILTTHDMRDIEELCSRVIVIDSGTKMFDGELSELSRQFDSEESMKIVVRNGKVDISVLNTLPLTDYKLCDGELTVCYDKEKINSMQVLDSLRDKCEIVNFDLQTRGIDEIIRNMYIQLPNRRA